MSGLERIAGDVGRELRRFPAAATMAAVVAAWPDAVGEAVARNAWPARLARDGTVHVATSSSAWAFELTQLEREVRERLADALAGHETSVARLRFAPGRLPEAPAEARAPGGGGRVEPDPIAAAAGERLAATIGDEKLRKVVARAAAASLARAGTDRRF